MMDARDVHTVLEHYGALYEARDLDRLEEAVGLFVPGDEPEMVGTEAASRGDPDWAVGAAAVRALTEWDWRWWWDVDLDTANARITVCGDVAWASLPGALIQSDRAREGARKVSREAIVPRLRDALDCDDGALERLLDEISRLAGARARDLREPVGERRAMTLTVVLVRRGDRWLLHTTHWAIAAD